MIDNESFAQYLGVDYEKKGNLVYINCPYHADSHPSMVIYPDIEHAVHCYPCGQTVSWAYLAMEIKGISYRQALEDLGQETLPASQAHHVVKAPSALTFCEEPKPAFIEAYEQRFAQCSDDWHSDMVDWLKHKGLYEVARKLGWKWHAEGVFRHWKAGIVIPYYFNKKVVYARFRGLETSDVYNPRFAKPKGPQDVGVQPYFSTFRANDTVFIVEGESDAASVYAHGCSAIGIPGASSRKAINTTLAFIADHSYITRIVACGDRDAAGQKMNQLIREAMVELGVRAQLLTYTVESQQEKADLNDDHVAGLFKPPVEWTVHYKNNFDRNIQDNDFGKFVTEFDQFLLQKEAEGIDPWERTGSIYVCPSFPK